MSQHLVPMLADVGMTIPIRGRADNARSSNGVRLAALRAPLLVKLVGANLLVVAVLGLGWVLTAGEPATARPGVVHLAVLLLGVVVAVHVGLVTMALRPLVDMESVASRVWHGDLGARVEQSAVADQRVLRIGSMFNILLDQLASDRERMRALATEVIEVGDRERAELARELHDSTAQRVAGLLMEISAAARDCPDPEVAERLQHARDAASAITEELRLIAQNVHPRVLDDLGLVAALKKLARDSSRGTGVDVDVKAADRLGEIPAPVAGVLYRVAQEAVRNAMRHASPRQVRVTAEVDGQVARLEIRDDGQGFDLLTLERQRRGNGLLSIRDRLALVDGTLDVRTAEGAGTTVIATIPLLGPSGGKTRERS